MFLKKILTCAIVAALMVPFSLFQELSAMDKSDDETFFYCSPQVFEGETDIQSEASIYLEEPSGISGVIKDELPLFLKQLSHGLEEKKMHLIIGALDDFLSKVPDFIKDENEREAFYHALFVMLLRFAGCTVESDTATGNGRVDAKVIPRNKARKYFFEFKINSSVKEDTQKEHLLGALKQIFEKRYFAADLPYKNPMTLAGISFFGKSKAKTINDGFNEASCLTLDLETLNQSTKAYSLDGQELGRYSSSKTESWKDFCSGERFSDSLVQKKDMHFEEAIQVERHQLLSEISRVLLSDQPRLDSFFQVISGFVYSIGYLQRLSNKKYYLGLLYSALTCAGFEVAIENEMLVVKTESGVFRFSCSFISSESSGDIVKKEAEAFAAMFSVPVEEKAIPNYFSLLGVNRMSEHSDVCLVPRAVCVFNEETRVCEGFDQAELPCPFTEKEAFVAAIKGGMGVVSSPFSDKKITRFVKLSGSSNKKTGGRLFSQFDQGSD